MKTFRHKILYHAVQSTMRSANASAVLHPDSLGHALVYPYYTMLHGASTLLAPVDYTSLVSAVDTSGKGVKVKIVEGRNAQEVLDFNLFLQPMPFVKLGNDTVYVVPFHDLREEAEPAMHDYMFMHRTHLNHGPRMCSLDVNNPGDYTKLAKADIEKLNFHINRKGK